MIEADGANGRIVSDSLDLYGAPAWSPDGQSIISAVTDHGTPHLFRVPVDGHAPAVFLKEYSVDPVWAPDARFVVYSGPDIGTTFSVKSVTAGASPEDLAGADPDAGRPTSGILAGRAGTGVPAGRDSTQESLADRSRHGNGAAVDGPSIRFRRSGFRYLARRPRSRPRTSAGAFQCDAARSAPAVTVIRNWTASLLMMTRCGAAGGAMDLLQSME